MLLRPQGPLPVPFLPDVIRGIVTSTRPWIPDMLLTFARVLMRAAWTAVKPGRARGVKRALGLDNQVYCLPTLYFLGGLSALPTQYLLSRFRACSPNIFFWGLGLTQHLLLVFRACPPSIFCLGVVFARQHLFSGLRGCPPTSSFRV